MGLVVSLSSYGTRSRSSLAHAHHHCLAWPLSASTVQMLRLLPPRGHKHARGARWPCAANGSASRAFRPLASSGPPPSRTLLKIYTFFFLRWFSVSPGFGVLRPAWGEAACRRRRGCSGSPSSACFSSGTLSPFQMTVLLCSLIAPRMCFSQLVFPFRYSSVCLMASHWRIWFCCLCSCVMCSIRASCVQESHLRWSPVEAIGLERQGQGSLHMVRRRVLGVQQPRGYSVRTLNWSLSLEPPDFFHLFRCNLLWRLYDSNQNLKVLVWSVTSVFFRRSCGLYCLLLQIA